MGIKRHKDGKRWVADHYAPDGKRKRPIFNTQKEAKEFLVTVETQKKGGTYVDPATSKGITFSILWDRWMIRVKTKGARGNRPARPDTLRGYQFNYGHYIKAHWQYRPLSTITRLEVEQWADTLTTPKGSPASDYGRERAVMHLTRALDFAVAEGLLSSNPAKDRAGKSVPTPVVKATKKQVRLTMAQLVRLASCAGEHRTMVLFVGLTGLRWGEVSTLRRKHFDFGSDDKGRKDTVAVEAAVSKTREQRIVPIPQTVADMILELLAEKGPEERAFPSPRGRALDPKNFNRRDYKPAGQLAGSAVAKLQDALGVKDDHKRIQDGDTFALVAVFGETTEQAVKAWQVTNGFPETGVVSGAEWQALGLPELAPVRLAKGDTDFKAPTFHNLRHTAVSLAISAGANIKLVQRIAGHKSATMTLDVYADLFDDDLHDSARRLDGPLRELLESQTVPQ